MNSSNLPKFDLVVLGGGPAGSSGAMTAGLLGKKVALVEKAGLIGGAGINTGTIPSKTLRETSLMLSGWRSRKLFGVGLIAMLMNATAELFDRTCFNYPTLGDLYKYAAYDAILQKYKPSQASCP